MARMLGYLYGIVVGDWAIGPGWIARAQHLLGVAADSSERGWVDPARYVAAAAGNALLGAIQGNQPAMDDFISVNAGTLSPEVFFSPEHLARTFEAAPISV